MIKRLLIAVLAAGLGPLARAQAPAAGAAQRIVAFSRQTPWDERRKLLGALGIQEVRELKLIDAIVVRAPLGKLSAVEAQLKSAPQVLRVEEDLYQNWLAGPEFESVLPASPLKPGAELPPAPAPPVAPPASADPEVPWGVARVNAPAAWTVSRGAGVRVAVVDTGIDAKNAELAPNILGGFNAIDPTLPFDDDHGHGTHVSGTIAAVQNSTGVVGVAPSAGLYGVKVLDKSGSGTFSDVIAGIDWAVEHGAQVISMSLGAAKGTPSLEEAVKEAVRSGVAVICAAGNSGGAVGFPAAYPAAIAVSASDASDQIAKFSSRGPQVAFIAPGVKVLSTLPGGAYAAWSGTSMAAPHVSGLAALKLAVTPGLSPDALRAALSAAASPLPGLTTDEQGAGLIDAARLVGAAAP